MEAALNFCLLFFQEKRKKKSVVLWRLRRSRVRARDEGLEQGCVVKG